jgi:zinc transport system ATP-binding protein
MSTADAAEPVLDVVHVAVGRPGDWRLDDVSLRVARGSLHVIVGPNGAGKTTLLSAILGLVPFSGRIALNWSHGGAIGYVPQNFVVDRTLPLTVADFLALTRQRRPVCLGLSRRTRDTLHTLLARVGLPHVAMRPLASLSGGELRRVLLAHALDPEPELLVLDEPTTGLDEHARRWLEECLTNIARTGPTTVLMVSHDLEQVRRIATRVTVLDRQVIADGHAADVLATTSLLDRLPVRHGWVSP